MSQEPLGKRLARGDRIAMGAIFDAFYEPLRLLARSMVRSPDEAKCRVNSAFGRLVDNLSGISSLTDEQLFQRLTRLLADEIRFGDRQRPQRTLAKKGADYVKYCAARKRHDEAMALEDAEAATKLLESAMAAISNEQKSVITRSLLNEERDDRLAEIMGKSYDAYRQWKGRVVAKLRESLKPSVEFKSPDVSARPLSQVSGENK